ncbi:MAG: hypothetical protein ACOY30_07475 [Bacillota bacterium]
MKSRFLVVMTIILVLALFPAGVYAATDHSLGAESPGTTQQQGATQPGQQTGTAPGSGNHMMDMQGMEQQMQQMMNMPANDQINMNMQGEGGASPGSSGGHESSGGHGEKSASGGEGHESSGGHGEETKKSVLEPVKSQIVAGFAGLNLLVILAALIMKKKLGQGG